jgi:hypothetical protein
MPDISDPRILPVAFGSPSYFVRKKTLMFVADLMTGSTSLIFCETSGCGKLSVFFSDCCEVGYPDVVAEGFEVEFSSLRCWFAACEMVSVASLQGAVD